MLREEAAAALAEIAIIVDRHEGEVRQLLAEELVAVFGSPVAHDDDTLRALRAVGEARAALPERFVLRAAVERLAGRRTQSRSSKASGACSHRLPPATCCSAPRRCASCPAAVDVVPHESGVGYRVLRFDPGAESFARHLDVPIVGRIAELDALDAALAEVERSQLRASHRRARRAGDRQDAARERVRLAGGEQGAHAVGTVPGRTATARACCRSATSSSSSSRSTMSSRLSPMPPASSCRCASERSPSRVTLSGRSAGCSRCRQATGRWSSCSRICTGQRPTCSTSSSTCSAGRQARCCCSASRGPSCSSRGPSGATTRSRSGRSQARRLEPSSSCCRSGQVCRRASSARRSRWPKATRCSWNSSSSLPPRTCSIRCRRRSRFRSRHGSTVCPPVSAPCSSGQRSSGGTSGGRPSRQSRPTTSGRRSAAHLIALARRRLVHAERATLAGEDGFRFHHALIRDAVYAGVPEHVARRAARGGRARARRARPGAGRSRRLSPGARSGTPRSERRACRRIAARGKPPARRGGHPRDETDRRAYWRSTCSRGRSRLPTTTAGSRVRARDGVQILG